MFSFSLHLPPLRAAGFLLILLSACSLLALYSLFGLGATSGGVLGQAVSSSMVRFFNLPATTLILVAIFLFALTVTTGLSWFRLMDLVGGYTLEGLLWLKGVFTSDDKEGDSEEKEAPTRSKGWPAVGCLLLQTPNAFSVTKR